jgi:plasmid maintenance system antidote protein VapI
MVKKEFMKENELLDIIKDEFRLKNDRELAQFLEVQPSMVSKLRNGKTPFTAHQILLIHDATDWSIQKIRGYLPGSSVAE